MIWRLISGCAICAKAAANFWSKDSYRDPGRCNDSNVTPPPINFPNPAHGCIASSRRGSNSSPHTITPLHKISHMREWLKSDALSLTPVCPILFLFPFARARVRRRGRRYTLSTFFSATTRRSFFDSRRKAYLTRFHVATRFARLSLQPRRPSRRVGVRRGGCTLSNIAQTISSSHW